MPDGPDAFLCLVLLDVFWPHISNVDKKSQFTVFPLKFFASDVYFPSIVYLRLYLNNKELFNSSQQRFNKYLFGFGKAKWKMILALSLGKEQSFKTKL